MQYCIFFARVWIFYKVANTYFRHENLRKFFSTFLFYDCHLVLFLRDNFSLLTTNWEFYCNWKIFIKYWTRKNAVFRLMREERMKRVWKKIEIFERRACQKRAMRLLVRVYEHVKLNQENVNKNLHSDRFIAWLDMDRKKK